MTPSTTRVLIACLWIATLGGAYFMGRKGAGPALPRNSTASVGREQSGIGGDPAAEPAAGRGAPSETKAERPSVKDMILQARASLGSGMGSFMNMRGMLRALAPLAELTDAEIQEALAEVERTVKEPQQKMMFYSMLLTQWAESDGPAALAYAKEKMQGQGPLMASVTMSVVGTWARRDPEAAWRWYLDAREKGERSPTGGAEGYMAGIFSGMAASNVDAALGRLATLQDHERPMAIQGITMSAMDSRVRDNLLSRAGSMDAKTKASVYQGVVGMWMMTDSEGATKWLATLPEEDKKPLVTTAGTTLMYMNPEKGAELQLENAGEKELPQTYSRIVSQWAGRDPQAAGDWLNKQPQGPQLDEARRSFAVAISGRDPAGAYDWARAMQDESKRMDAYKQIYQTMDGKDPQKANAGLEASGLPPEVIAKIREDAAAKKAKTTAQ